MQTSASLVVLMGPSVPSTSWYPDHVLPVRCNTPRQQRLVMHRLHRLGRVDLAMRKRYRDPLVRLVSVVGRRGRACAWAGGGAGRGGEGVGGRNARSAEEKKSRVLSPADKRHRSSTGGCERRGLERRKASNGKRAGRVTRGPVTLATLAQTLVKHLRSSIKKLKPARGRDTEPWPY